MRRSGRRAAAATLALVLALLVGGLTGCRTSSGGGRADANGTARASTPSGDPGNPAAGDAATGDPGGDGSAHDGSTDPADAPVNRSFVAHASVADLQLFDSPGGSPSALGPLRNPNDVGAPLVLLVTARQAGWLQVLLPVRPNGSQAWIQEQDATVAVDDWRMEVHLGAHQLVVYDGAEVWMAEPIAVGREPTPTPGGTFYLTELLQPPDPGGDYGPFAYGLSGFSDDLTSFNGGDGRLGLHGTNDPSTLGSDVSHGCIRLANEAISQLARTLPLGTPVVILP